MLTHRSSKCVANSLKCHVNSLKCVANSMKCVGNSLKCVANSLMCVANSLKCVANSLKFVANSLKCVANSLKCVANPLKCVFNSLKCVDCCVHFAHASLVRLEEEPIHVCQLHFVVVKENQLKETHITTSTCASLNKRDTADTCVVSLTGSVVNGTHSY